MPYRPKQEITLIQLVYNLATIIPQHQYHSIKDTELLEALRNSIRKLKS